MFQPQSRALRPEKKHVEFYDIVDIDMSKPRLVPVKTAHGRKIDRLTKDYESFFAGCREGELYRVYDVSEDQFVQSTNVENQLVFDRELLAKTLARVEADDKDKLRNWIVVIDDDFLDFSQPIFIGTEDMRG